MFPLIDWAMCPYNALDIIYYVDADQNGYLHLGLGE